MSIPRIIHYCWLGPAPLPEKVVACINSWKKYCPDYEIKLWNEENFDIAACPYAREAYEAGKFAFASDYIRLKVLEQEGGIYLDTDVELCRPLDDLLGYAGFMGFQAGKPTPTGRRYRLVSGAGMGFEAGHPFLKRMLADYQGLSFYKENGDMDLTTCVERNTRALAEYGLLPNGKRQEIDRVLFLPPACFCPLDYVTGKMKITRQTYAIHWFAGSWLDEAPKKASLKLLFKCSALGMFIWKLKRTICRDGEYH